MDWYFILVFLVKMWYDDLPKNKKNVQIYTYFYTLISVNGFET
jgi:hypothetical protein